MITTAHIVKIRAQGPRAASRTESNDRKPPARLAPHSRKCTPIADSKADRTKIISPADSPLCAKAHGILRDPPPQMVDTRARIP